MTTTRIVLRQGSIQTTAAQVNRIRTEVERLHQREISVYHVFVDRHAFHIEEIDRMFFWNEGETSLISKPEIAVDKYAYSVACPDCGEQLEGRNQTRGNAVEFTRRCKRCKSIVRVTLTWETRGWDGDAVKIVPRFVKSEDHD